MAQRSGALLPVRQRSGRQCPAPARYPAGLLHTPSNPTATCSPTRPPSCLPCPAWSLSAPQHPAAAPWGFFSLGSVAEVRERLYKEAVADYVEMFKVRRGGSYCSKLFLLIPNSFCNNCSLQRSTYENSGNFPCGEKGPPPLCMQPSLYPLECPHECSLCLSYSIMCPSKGAAPLHAEFCWSPGWPPSPFPWALLVEVPFGWAAG